MHTVTEEPLIGIPPINDTANIFIRYLTRKCLIWILFQNIVEYHTSIRSWWETSWSYTAVLFLSTIINICFTEIHFTHSHGVGFKAITTGHIWSRLGIFNSKSFLINISICWIISHSTSSASKSFSSKIF